MVPQERAAKACRGAFAGALRSGVAKVEVCVRKGLIVPSVLALSLALGACQVTTAPGNETGAATAQQPVGPPQWSDSTAAQLRRAIGNRGVHALDHVNFDAGGTGSADGAALTRAALAYAGALARGASDPKKLYEVYTVPRPDPDLARGLAAAVRDGKVEGWLDSLAPQDEAYRKLSAAYLALRRTGSAAPQAIPGVAKPIEPGQSDPRMPLIARQLAASDYLEPAAGQGDAYTPAMVAAVKRMQADYGIKPDGLIGTDALEILNLSDEDRARAIAVNMERLRWLDRQPPATRIDVNVAAARLSYWRDGKLVDSRRVVVGEPDAETPQLGSPIFRLVANPTWTVPRSIQNKEIAGKGSAYLRRNNMVWKGGWIVQQPGPKNSLGLVKFDMQNDHAIYLHDTPAKALFSEVQRQRSHGCVRVEDALGFADLLAKDEGVTDEWHRARQTGKETFVKLPRQIPVRLLYQTVLLDADGAPVIRADPYGWNDRVAEALGFAQRASRQAKAGAADVGP